MMTVRFVAPRVGNEDVFSRFGPSGIPVTVRNFLRPAIIDLTKRVGAQVNANLNSGLKSRRRLQVKSEMIENPSELIGRVSVVATAPPMMLPQWLESGTAAHKIEAKNAKALFFFWNRVGRNVFFKSVNHPGFAGIHYLENAFESMKDEIKSTIRRAVSDGLGTRR
jgi:hypothetical protein